MIRLPRLLLPLGLTLGLLAGCQPRPLTLSLAIADWPGYEYFSLAARQELDRAVGLDLRILPYSSPQAMVTAYRNGQLAIAPMTTVEAVLLCRQVPQRCPVIALVLDESLGGDQLIAARGITDLQGFLGRTVGVVPGGLGHYVLARALEQAGLSPERVQVRDLPPDTMAMAVRDGQLAGVHCFPPFSEEVKQLPGTRQIFDSSRLRGEIYDVLAIDPTTFRDQQPALKALVEAWLAAHRYRRQQPQQALALLARRQNLTSREFLASEAGLRYYPSPREQRTLLAPGGAIARSLTRIESTFNHIRPTPTASPRPRLSSELLPPDP